MKMVYNTTENVQTLVCVCGLSENFRIGHFICCTRGHQLVDPGKYFSGSVVGQVNICGLGFLTNAASVEYPVFIANHLLQGKLFT